MNILRQWLPATLLGSALVLGGCAAPYGYYGPGPVAAPRTQYGVVEAIDVFRGDGSGPVGVGALLGGVAGGVIGHQFGGGSGNTVATIAGAVGGAVVGNEVERQNRVEGSRYRITVRTDSSSIVQLDNSNDLNLRVGDRVRIEGNRVYRM
ncbi:MAG: glycine zipper 2TM domain-containing protein [Pseudomonadota bacterium]|nr:glycine zipper 2TM domain-containing protein [Pseudomonadota bacterium]